MQLINAMLPAESKDIIMYRTAHCVDECHCDTGLALKSHDTGVKQR